jgi:hypothetical protein
MEISTMARNAQKFREIIEMLPKPTDTQGFTPEVAALCLAQLANGALRIIAEQEEIIEDLEKEVTSLQEMAAMPVADWQKGKNK